MFNRVMTMGELGRQVARELSLVLEPKDETPKQKRARKRLLKKHRRTFGRFT